MSVKDVAGRYFTCVHNHDADQLSRLFADDGWLRPPPPVKEQLQGVEAIRKFYSDLFSDIPDLSIDPDYQLFADGNVCVALFSSTTHGVHRHRGVIDVFTVNDRDELIEMVAYSRFT
jgi:ketosteroid isomerase-like protein